MEVLTKPCEKNPTRELTALIYKDLLAMLESESDLEEMRNYMSRYDSEYDNIFMRNIRWVLHNSTLEDLQYLLTDLGEMLASETTSPAIYILTAKQLEYVFPKH